MWRSLKNLTDSVRNGSEKLVRSCSNAFFPPPNHLITNRKDVDNCQDYVQTRYILFSAIQHRRILLSRAANDRAVNEGVKMLDRPLFLTAVDAR